MGCPRRRSGSRSWPASADVCSFASAAPPPSSRIGVGDLIVSEGRCGTTARRPRTSHPGIRRSRLRADADAEAGRRRARREPGFASHAGLNATDDAFYAETPEWIAKLSRLGMLNVEMESSALFVVARQRGLRAGMVCAVSANLVTGDVVYGAPNTRLHTGWEHSIEVALEAVHGSASGALALSTINLHTHLEGCVRLETAAELAASTGVATPDGGWEEALVMREPSRPDGVPRPRRRRVPGARLGRRDRAGRPRGRRGRRRRRLRFFELRFGPSTHARPGFGVDDVIAAVCRASRAEPGDRDAGGLVVCVLRHHDEDDEPRDRSSAAARAGDGVVGFDVAGDELLYPDSSRSRGRSNARPRRASGSRPTSPRRAGEQRPRRGTRCWACAGSGTGRASATTPRCSPGRRPGMCLEVCATSNVLTGAAPSIARAPDPRVPRGRLQGRARRRQPDQHRDDGSRRRSGGSSRKAAV